MLNDHPPQGRPAVCAYPAEHSPIAGRYVSCFHRSVAGHGPASATMYSYQSGFNPVTPVAEFTPAKYSPLSRELARGWRSPVDADPGLEKTGSQADPPRPRERKAGGNRRAQTGV